MYEIIDRKGKKREYKTVLEGLRDMAVVDIEAVSGGFLISEQCDQWFSATITGDVLTALANELLMIAAGRDPRN